jgi:3-carboxy-cis,cis-muconate cycloisomerase
MAASVFDSPLYAKLFPTNEAGRLFSDSAALRAMLLVEGALAKVQGALGIIPAQSAAAIHRASLEIQIDPGALAQSTGENGVCVPGLLAAFRQEMNAPEHAQYLHWGATSQDIIDTGLMLRLRQVLMAAESDLKAQIAALARGAKAHADLPMAARTYGQIATPTSWGAVLANWGMQAMDALTELEDLRQGALVVSLSGAAGTGAALGPQAAQVRADLAGALGLHDPGRSWHTDRGPLLRIVDWMGRNGLWMGGMGQTLIDLAASGVQEIDLGGGGASSTMPQKQNPVAPSVLVALGHQISGLRAGLHAAGGHRHQRDGAAWFSEWMLVPQICLAHAALLGQGAASLGRLSPIPAQMARTLDHSLGLVHAEALAFALCAKMRRSEAQSEAKALCRAAMNSARPLAQVVAEAHPDLDAGLFNNTRMGEAPAEARRFVERAQAQGLA